MCLDDIWACCTGQYGRGRPRHAGRTERLVSRRRQDGEVKHWRRRHQTGLGLPTTVFESGQDGTTGPGLRAAVYVDHGGRAMPEPTLTSQAGSPAWAKRS